MTVGKGKLQLYQDKQLGGITRYYMARKEDTIMRVPDMILSCVAFVCYKMASGELRFAGTAFFVGIPSQDNMSFIHTVTARHVIDDVRNKGLDKVYLRLNSRAGDVSEVETDINDWYFHPTDKSVDVAVYEDVPPPEVFEIGVIPVEMFLNDRIIQEGVKRYDAWVEYKIGVGDEVFIAGLFVKHSGRQRNSPIVRMGNIAQMPSEGIAKISVL